MGLIDNLYFYYKKSSEVRLNKLSRDIKEHCKVINLHELLPYDIFFSADQKRVNMLPETIKYDQKTYAYGKIVVWDKNVNSDFNKMNMCSV